MTALRVLAQVFLSLASLVRSKPITYLSYSEITDRLAVLAGTYGHIIKLEAAQDKYGLPSVGMCSRTASKDDCKTWVVTLTDHASLADDPARPHVLVSGELHGDEVVGPHAVLAYLEMVAKKVDGGDVYFKRMVRSRILVALPMANAVGFYRNERGERPGGSDGVQIDPNRDFAFDQDPQRCMQTVAARAINELMRNYMFRVLITFHGGTNVVGYEWGDKSHCDDRICKPAPDQEFMHALGVRMSDYAGSLPHESKYPVGTMGALVYPVHGGMEDWAYGASWNDEAVVCNPDTLDGYPKSKTTYNEATHRCVTFLVETATSKKPEESTLGDDSEMLDAGGAGDGHVPRNVRLLVAAVDAVEPYVVFSNATLNVGRGGHDDLVVHWFVAGSFIVDGTHLEWSDTSDKVYGTSDIFNGTAGAPIAGTKPSVFRAVVPKMPKAGTPLYLRAAAVVDTVMATVPAIASPSGQVQTHLVGSRVDSAWSYTNAGKEVRGRRVFYTPTMRAVIDPTTGKLSVSADKSKDNWESSSLKAPGTKETEIALLRGSGRGMTAWSGSGISSSPSNLSSVGSSTEGKPHVMDPRDRDAVFSGVLGVALLLSMTGIIVVAIFKHYRRRRHEKEAVFTVSEEEELKEPLQNGGTNNGNLGGPEEATSSRNGAVSPV